MPHRSGRLFLLMLLLFLGGAPLALASPPAPKLCPLRPELEKALHHFQELAARGEWPKVAAGATLREGEHGERVAQLRARLAASGELPAEAAQGDRFDAALAEALRKFQARHGLNPDGAAGKSTVAALNVSIAERVRQLEVNLERCQPLPQMLEPRHILVNIADFSLNLYEDGKPALSMPVIVGRTYRQTPVLSSIISTIILNPPWSVPDTIARKDILDHIRKEPGYLRKHNFRVYRGWGKGGEEIDPDSVEWSKLSGRMPYRFRQEPGAVNALGRIKFQFPNEYDVYLHDTPSRQLFSRESRTFSSGCIRVGKPLDLATHLLKGSKLGELAALNAAIASGKTQQVPIPAPIPVHVVYMTAWVDGDGLVQFRSDVYGRDGQAAMATTDRQMARR
ncbi:MAG: L,D-transpeptidase family protein [Thermodesulfobacteriota bacterium]